MPVQAAFLRGINVGGRNRLAMAEVRALFVALGLADVQSVLQSGNLIFRSSRSGSGLERLLEAETKKRFALAVDYCVRTAGECAEIIARNPFPREARDDPSHLVVMFLKKAPADKDVAALRRGIQGREQIAAVGQQLYIVYLDGVGRSKLTGTLIERMLGTRGTGRNWNTLRKVAALMK